MAVQVDIMPRKKKPDAETAAHAGQSAKIPLDVLKMARAVVGIRGGSVSQLIGEICRPALVRMIQDMQKSGEFLPKPEE